MSSSREEPDFFSVDYPYSASNYLVITDNGVTGFSKISGMTVHSHELSPLTEGGLKGVHILAEQDRQINTLVLEKGVGNKGVLESLGPLRTFMIASISREGNYNCIYSVSGAVLQKLTISDFNANDSSILISSATVAYRRMVAMSLDDGGNSGASESLDNPKSSKKASDNEGTTKSPKNDSIEGFKSINAEVDARAAKALSKEPDDAQDDLT